MTVSERLQQIAEHIEATPIDDDIITVSFTPQQRDLVVLGLKGASALSLLAELPPRS